MPDHIATRRRLLEALREELVGPSPQGIPIDCTTPITFDQREQSFGPWRQAGSGEEILQRDRPVKRYGIGVLHPLGTMEELDLDTTLPTEDGEPDVLTGQAQSVLEAMEERSGGTVAEAENDDLDLSTANTYRPSTMGISFLAELDDEAVLRVTLTGGRYRRKAITVAGQQRDWWLRSPLQLSTSFTSAALRAASGSKVAAANVEYENTDNLDLRVEVFARPFENYSLITACIVNRTPFADPVDERCVFQTHLVATITGETSLIRPYPVPEAQQPDEEEDSLALVYRHQQTFAVGHGCAAEWDTTTSEQVHSVSGECLPTCEVPSITSEITGNDGARIEVSMATLAGLRDEDPLRPFDALIAEYEVWIQSRTREAQGLMLRYQPAARRHLEACNRCVARMRRGLEYLRNNPIAFRAFQLANHAMLLQQLRGRREPRRVQYDERAQRFTFLEPYPTIDVRTNDCYWRVFQAAFLLMSIESTGEAAAAERRTVELIWFPTGGGKTEAYLGLAAFSMFLRRLRDTHDIGVHVLTRYTLRLLTAQQFQRASGLICTMEYLRQQDRNLGDTPFSIGIWLGGSTTPNTRQEARSILQGLTRGDKYAENQFLLNRCPWCGAQLGPVKYDGRPPRGAPLVIGYERSGATVILRCTDQQCTFRPRLPVFVIDEDIYEERPTLVIGTIDKFAMLSWRPEARTLFGIASDGTRECSPPGLIIQDELHLIAGPLGSLAGLYETVIEELCTDQRNDTIVPPKIISSTATIRRYEDQIRSLYARTDTALFPPPGLDASDSFFARYASDDRGQLLPGQMYVGVHGAGLGSVQTAQVRTFTALLQAPKTFGDDERDPWWTLMVFFNSLRELGTTLSLFQSDIPDRFKVLRIRLGIPWDRVRSIWNIRELTGRLRSDEVPQAIAALEVPYGSTQRPVDVCLASNIIEVGIDIARLSLLCVVGQPKTTSQYIQVTGRVGRRWEERPGLVVTIYSPSKPRDRSHFEKFRSYHERLYSHVEPTSVTPFSPPTLDRALHAVLTVYARHFGDQRIAQHPYPYPSQLIERVRDIIHSRVGIVDPEERDNCERLLQRRAQEWQRWERTCWSGNFQAQDAPLLREAGAYVPREWARLSWPTPTSMRNVDAECDAIITSTYLTEGD